MEEGQLTSALPLPKPALSTSHWQAPEALIHDSQARTTKQWNFLKTSGMEQLSAAAYGLDFRPQRISLDPTLTLESSITWRPGWSTWGPARPWGTCRLVAIWCPQSLLSSDLCQTRHMLGYFRTLREESKCHRVGMR